MENEYINEKYLYKPIFYGKNSLDFAIYPHKGEIELSKFINSKNILEFYN